MNNNLIDQLATDLTTLTVGTRAYDNALTDLHNEIEPCFDMVVRNYLMNHNLDKMGLDTTDFYSSLYISMVDAIKGFNASKGSYLPRFRDFATKRFTNVVDKQLASSRRNKEMSDYSTEDLFESTENELVGDSEIALIEDGTTLIPKLIERFIKEDKDGQVIEIILTHSERAERTKALEVYFNRPYDGTSRKNVLRIKKRLEKFLLENDISLK